MKERLRALAGMATVAAALCAVLAVADPSLAELRELATDPQRLVDAVGADRVAILVVGAVVWGLTAWLCLAVLLSVLAAAPVLPAGLARAAQRAARTVSPHAVRAVVTAVVGVGLTAGPAYAAPASTGSAASVSTTYSSVTPVLADVPVDWPRANPTPTAAPTPPPTGSAEVGGVVVVGPGDCLWELVEDRLGPSASNTEIAAEVGRWWQTNRAVIGSDPDLIQPGQVLRPPK